MAAYQSAPPLRHLRQVMHPDYALLPHAELQGLVDGMYGPGAAERYDEYLEGLFDDIGRTFSSAARDVGKFAAKAAPVVATVGGGAIQGAMSGAQFGLPGIIAGAAVGGTGAGLSKYASGPARNIGGVLSGVTNIASQFSPMGQVGSSLGGAISGLAGGGGGKNLAGTAVNALSGLLSAKGGGAGGALGALGGLVGGGGGGAGGALGALGGLVGGGGGGGSAAGALTSLFGGGSAAGQMMSLLQRPETQRALAALNLGPLGRPSIPVGSNQTPVPVGAFTNLLGQLSHQASAEAAALAGDSESTLAYMTDQAGEFVGDPALDRDRAARVWEMLNEAQAERVVNSVLRQYRESAEAVPRQAYYRPERSDEAYYDAMDMADVYGIEAAESYYDYTGEFAYESGYESAYFSDYGSYQ